MVTGVAQILGRLVTILTDANAAPPQTGPQPLISHNDKLMALLTLLFLSLVTLCLSVRLAVNLVGDEWVKSGRKGRRWVRGLMAQDGVFAA